MKKEKYQKITKWFPIKTYQNNQIVLKNHRIVKLYQVKPINFKLKSQNEQEMILNTYQNLLKAMRGRYADSNSDR